MASKKVLEDRREKLEADLDNMSEQERIAARIQLGGLSNELAALHNAEAAATAAAATAAAAVPTGENPVFVHQRPTKAHAHCIPCSFRHIVRMFTLSNGSCLRTDVLAPFRLTWWGNNVAVPGAARRKEGAEQTLPDSNAPLRQPGMGLSNAYLRPGAGRQF